MSDLPPMATALASPVHDAGRLALREVEALRAEVAELRRMVQGVPADGQALPALDAVVLRVAAAYRLPAHLLVADGRMRSVMDARQVAMWVARTGGGWPLKVIGRALGGRDHSTIAHGIEVVAARRTRDPGFASHTNALLRQCFPLPHDGETA